MLSKKFFEVLEMKGYNLEIALRLYDEELEQNPGNFSAYNNRGLCKMSIAKKNYDNALIEDAKKDFRIAIKLCKDQGVGHFYEAENNLKDADSMHFFPGDSLF